MASKKDLRVQRVGTQINTTSKKQEKELDAAVSRIRLELLTKFNLAEIKHENTWRLAAVVKKLKSSFPDETFHYYKETSAMKPDGGILSMVNKKGLSYPILIAEKKNQGTNDARALEGKTKQSQGNAIERLGKNVIGFRTAFLDQSIFPFVCFGDGCDFAEGSSILDRVVTIAMFGKLNTEHVHVTNDKFNRGTFYFREEQWTENEMFERGLRIAISSVYYYFSKYGEATFLK